MTYVIEKAQTYNQDIWHSCGDTAEENSSILSSLQLLLLEHSVMCHLIVGSKAQAIKEIARVCRLLQADSKQLQVNALLFYDLFIYS